MLRKKRMPESSCDAITTGSGKQVHPFPMTIELMAWLGNFFLIAGQFKLGRKHWCAPWICNVGNALYLVYSAEKHTWALFAMTAVAFVIMVRCAILWRPRQYPHQRLLSEHPVNSPLTSSGVFRIGRTAGALALPGPQVCRKLINRGEKNAPRYLDASSNHRRVGHACRFRFGRKV